MSLDLTMTVLIVDDSPFMRKLFHRNLLEVGFENIVDASNGSEAIQRLEETKIDLVLCDWNMPEMDGLELLKYIRNNIRYQNIPFIMATAQGDKTKIEEASAAGSNNHIAKPFNAAELRSKINQVFGIEEKVVEKPKEERTVNKDGKIKLKIGHIQITDHLTLGILRHMIDSGEYTPKYFELETQCFPGWNPVQQQLEKGEIDGAFVLAPIAMDLYAYDVPIKLISLAHKNGSIFVKYKSFKQTESETSLYDAYYNKVIAIPHKMSVHNMLAHKFLSQLGLKPGVPGKEEINVKFEVIPPIKMPQFMMENRNVAGFIVAEPIGSNAIAKGIAELQFLSKKQWTDHPCCVVAFRDEMINKYPDAVYEFTELLAKSGKFAEENRASAAAIAVNFLDPQKKLGLSQPVLQRVLDDPFGIKMNDLFPVLGDLEVMQRYMHDNMGIGKLIDMEKFVDLRFADEARKHL